MFGKNRRPSAIDFVIVGLGNPGRQYENTRHNCGFIAVDMLCERLGCKMKKIRFKSTTGECVINGKKCMLMKPSTYMNNSGEAVVQAMNFYKLSPEQIIIIYDDISLEPGRLRIRTHGSDGGHNGMKNIIYLTGHDSFMRIKIGVGAKPHPDYDLKDWVLSGFDKKDEKTMMQVFGCACDAVELMVCGETEKAMQLYN